MLLVIGRFGQIYGAFLALTREPAPKSGRWLFLSARLMVNGS
jgi:hypothetical protein